jgi:hypothetical protein
LGYLTLIFLLYFIRLQIKKIKRTGTGLDKFQLLFHLLVLVFFILDQASTFASITYTINDIGTNFIAMKELFYLIFSAVLILLAYFIFLIQLRTFDTFAWMINLIIEVMKEIRSFTFIFFFIVCAFGNSIIILAMLERPDTSNHKFTGPNFFSAVIYAYRVTLGNLDDNSKLKYPIVYDIFLIITTLLLDIMALNLLVTILADIYYKVSQDYLLQRLNAKCRLINENEALFDRESIFRDCRYIVRMQVA